MLGNKKLPKISVVIPSYNKGKYIKRTLDSIFVQKYPKLEVIVQDGGSSDETLGILKKYSKKYSQFKFVSKKDSGQLDAINKGIKKSKGEIVTYINADDVYKRSTFKVVAEAYTKNIDSLWFVGRCDVIDKKGKKIARFVSSYKNILLSLNRYFFLLMVNYLMQPAVFLTRKAIKKYGSFKGTKNFVMEYALWLKIGKHQMPIVIDKNIASFRMAGDNISSLQFRNLLDTDYKILKRYSNNIIILFFHKLHNFLRVVTVKYLL